MRTSARLLQTACRRALDGLVPEAREVGKLIEDFRSKYGIRELDVQPFRLAGAQINGYEAHRQHFKDVRALPGWFAATLPSPNSAASRFQSSSSG